MVKGYDSVLVTVDHLTRMAHFTPCRCDITSKQTEELFVKEVIRLHGVPQVLVSDRDPLFTADFWASLWQLLSMSTAEIILTTERELLEEPLARP